MSYLSSGRGGKAGGGLVKTVWCKVMNITIPLKSFIFFVSVSRKEDFII